MIKDFYNQEILMSFSGTKFTFSYLILYSTMDTNTKILAPLKISTPHFNSQVADSYLENPLLENYFQFLHHISHQLVLEMIKESAQLVLSVANSHCSVRALIVYCYDNQQQAT